MYTLRPYQLDAVNKMIWASTIAGNDIVMIAQGGGKSIVIADFANKVHRNVLILQPSKELLKQNVEKMATYVPKEEIGIFSASLGLKEIRKFTFGTIQSVYKHPELFQDFNIAIVDECDLINPKHLTGMYNKFFKQANITKVFGLTGTPFRQDSYYAEPPEGWAAWKMKRWKNYNNIETITTTKMINRYKEHFWDRMLYVLNTHDLMVQNHLTPLNYIDKELIPHEQIPVNISKSDFDLEAYDSLIQDKEEKLVQGIQTAVNTHKSIIVYCASIDQAERFAKTFPKARVVSSETPAKDRDRIVSSFRKGEVKMLFNVSLFTIGFDHPTLDCIILVRPTRSLRLHLQILGRGTRNSDGKDKCDVIDFAGNVKALGKLEEIKVEKVDSLWNVTSPSYPNGFHMKELYRFKVTLQKKQPRIDPLF
jgi:DNA repair protein RadD